MDPGYDRLSLKGKVALVTGASSGIGREIALILGARGAAVAVQYRSGQERALAVVARITEAGGRAVSVQADVTDPPAIVRMVRQVEAELGTVEILVNNAGDFLEIHPFLEINEELWERSLSLNLMSAIRCARAVLPAMLRQGSGRVINLSSIVSRTGGPGETLHYAVAKGGLETLTVGLAREFAPRGVLVNAVAPGLIATPIHEKFRERFERIAPNYAPVGRAGMADEVAEVVAFLASDAASYVTGQIWHVNGGRL